MRDVLFKDLYTAMNIYEKTFNSQLLNFKFYQISYNVQSELENDSVLLASDHFFVDETQSVEFDAQLNTALRSQEILEINSDVRIMPRASHRDTDKRRVNQVNENSKLKSEIYLDAKTICTEERVSARLDRV